MIHVESSWVRMPWEPKPIGYAGAGKSGAGSVEAIEHPVYGAIAVSIDTFAWGSSTGYAKIGDARQDATRRCAESGAKDCRVKISTKESCLALAIAPRIIDRQSGAWGTGVDENIDKAKAEALKNCGKYEKKCKIVESFCPRANDVGEKSKK
jgi:hypothetical protein